MTRRFIMVSLVLVAMLAVAQVGFATQTTNRAWSVHTWQIRYDGHIHFVPSSRVPANAGYGLLEGRNVSRGWIDYFRGSVRVTINGQRVWTAQATDMRSNAQYSAHAAAWDSFNPWAPVTEFHRGWIYF